jgi:hypothetical protein
VRLKVIFAAVAVAVALLVSAPASPAGAKGPYADPACVEYCRLQVLDCFFAGGTERECGRIYKKCLAHCEHKKDVAP